MLFKCLAVLSFFFISNILLRSRPYEAPRPSERPPGDRTQDPNMVNPIVDNSECLFKNTGMLRTSTDDIAPCRYSPDGLTDCCRCSYEKHFRYLLSAMIRVAQIYGVGNRIGGFLLRVPDPAEFGEPDTYVAPIEADETYKNGHGVIFSRCRVTLALESYQKFITMMKMYSRRNRKFWYQSSINSMVTKQMKLNCGTGYTYRRALVPSQRQYMLKRTKPLPLLNIAGLTDPASLDSKALTAFCVPDPDIRRFDEAHASELVQPERPALQKSDVPAIRASAHVIMAPGASTCLEVPISMSDSHQTAESSTMGIAAAVMPIEPDRKRKGIASFEDPIEISSDDDDPVADYEPSQRRARYVDGIDVTSLRLVSTSYAAKHPGQYVTRTLEEAGPSNYFEFTTPRPVLPFDLNKEPPPEDVPLGQDLQLCATLGIPQDPSITLALGWHQVSRS